MPKVTTPRSVKLARHQLAFTPPKTPSKSGSKRKVTVIEPVLGRETELAYIRNFIAEHVSKNTSGCLYISGTPGTGKTACIEEIYREHEGVKCKINCMGIEDPRTVYSLILSDIEGKPSDDFPLTPSRNVRHLERLEKALRDPSRIKLIVLDEIDQLLTNDSTLLDRMFRWPSLPGYYVILIGIANKLDLTSSITSQLVFRSNTGTPNKLHFRPYTKDQVTDILKSKIQIMNDEDTDVKFQPIAIDLCAKRVANRSGDIRMAMSIVKRGVRDASTPLKKRFDEVSENDPTLDTAIDVKISHIQTAMNEQSAVNTLKSLPTQQRMLICCALLLAKAKQPITIGKLDAKYSEISASRGDLLPLSQDILPFCRLLASLGVFSLKENKTNPRQSIICFKSEEEAEFNVAGKPLMDSILKGTDLIV